MSVDVKSNLVDLMQSQRREKKKKINRLYTITLMQNRKWSVAYVCCDQFPFFRKSNKYSFAMQIEKIVYNLIN